MAMISGPFNSVNRDRLYGAEWFGGYFSDFIGNGVYPNPSTNFQVMANNDMTITVSKGKGYINGVKCEDKFNYTANIDVADGVLNRIDRVVLRLDTTLDRDVRIVVKKGTFGSSPVAPILQRDADAYELALADVYVGKGVISISQANITDTRLDSELCGIVHGVVDQVDVTTLFNQYSSAFADDRVQFQQDFNLWFTTIQDILDENVAANLASQILALETNLGTHLADIASQAHLAKNIGLEDTTGNFVATEIEGAMSELFTNVSDGKDLVGGAITDVDDSVVIPTDPTFNDLASAIGGISTGKKWASGVADRITGSKSFYDLNSQTFSASTILVSGIGFKPSIILVIHPNDQFVATVNTNFINTSRGVSLFFSYTDLIRMVRLTGEAYVTSTGFQLPVPNYSTFEWIAFE